MTIPGIEVRQATVADLHLLVPVFDAYRQFYRQPSDPERARRFLLERFERNYIRASLPQYENSPNSMNRL
ncbi:MAG: GNAT family N-acetyltransferase, partial [Acidobacteriota bacterium]|nr:GNAT family N-acetyltransferase [Acidobacteriota bacterium]